MSPFSAFLQSRLQHAEEKGTLRQLTSLNPQLEDFVSNDYLGLARSVELYRMINTKLKDNVALLNGATGSRLLSGNSAEVELLESKLARIFRSEAALVFNSGYSANVGVFSAIPQKGDTIFYDELIHASAKDGMRLSLAQRFPFRHNDFGELKKKIDHFGRGNVYVAVESVYSMDGDFCNLEELVALCQEKSCVLIVDEAHSTGLFGGDGEGLAVSLGLQEKIPIRVYTFGKAMGVHGACVAGTKELRNFLVNFSRPFIYATALTPHSIKAIACAFDYLKQNAGLQQILKNKVKLYLATIQGEKNQHLSPIQTAIIPGNANVRKCAKQLQHNGFDIRPIVSPTVPIGKERLRICLHSFNSDEKIIAVANALNNIATHD